MTASPDERESLPVAAAVDVRRAAQLLVRQDRGAFLLIVLLNVLATGAGLLGPWLLGRIINTVTAGGPVSRVDRLAVLIIAAALLQLVLTRYARLVGARFGERTSTRIRETFLSRLLRLPASVVERVRTGDLTARAAGDVTTVAAAMRDAAPDVLIATAQVLLILVAVIAVDPVLGLVVLVGSSGIWFVTRWYLRRAGAAYLAQSAANSDLAEMLAATTSGGRTVEALGLQHRRLQTSLEAIGRSRVTRLRTLALRSVLFPVIDVASVLPLAGVLLVGGVLHDRGAVSLGAVVACALYVRQLSGPLDALQLWVDQLQSAGASFARLEGLGQVPAGSAPVTAAPVDDRIRLRAVSYAYEPGRDVLHEVDLDVRPGERLAVVGPSGAGKSTLGRLLAGVDRPRTGSLTVGGVAVADLAPDQLRRQVLLVTQEHHVFRDSVRGNLLMARPSATDEELRAALRAVGVRWLDELPEGLDTQLGAETQAVDAGQAQQLALARVVLADPHTVVLDEATAMLDPSTARDTERALSAVLAGRTVVAIAHRLHTAHQADRIAVLEHGRLVETGSHHDLVARAGSYAELWRSWHGDPPGSSSEPGRPG
jgi:ATP-binding cassette subfamily C protein